MERLRKFLGTAQVNLTPPQRRYQADFDRNAKTVEKVVAGDELFVHIARDTKVSLLEATNMDNAFEPSRKLMAKVYGSYKTLRTTPETVGVVQDGLENNISVQRVVKPREVLVQGGN